MVLGFLISLEKSYSVCIPERFRTHSCSGDVIYSYVGLWFWLPPYHHVLRCRNGPPSWFLTSVSLHCRGSMLCYLPSITLPHPLMREAGVPFPAVFFLSHPPMVYSTSSHMAWCFSVVPTHFHLRLCLSYNFETTFSVDQQIHFFSFDMIDHNVKPGQKNCPSMKFAQDIYIGAFGRRANAAKRMSRFLWSVRMGTGLGPQTT